MSAGKQSVAATKFKQPTAAGDILTWSGDVYRLDGQRVESVERGCMSHLGSLSVEERQSLGWFNHLKTSIGLFHAYADKERDTIYTSSYIICKHRGLLRVSDYVQNNMRYN